MRHYFFKSVFARKAWELIVTLSIIVLALVLVGEFFVTDKWILELLHELDFIALVILAMDLIMMFSVAENKITFLEHESILIASFIPFGKVFLFLEELRVMERIAGLIGKIGESMHVFTHLSRLARFIRAGIQVKHLTKKKQKEKKKNKSKT